IDLSLNRDIACDNCPNLSFDPASFSLPDATAGVPYSTTITASGGTPPYTYSIAFGDPAPDGLTLDSETGVLSGIPISPGFFGPNIQARDANGCASIHPYNLNVNCAVM